MFKKINLDKLIIYDIETNVNALILCFKDYKTKNKKSFILHEDQNDSLELYKFLRRSVKNGYTLLGFNVLGFDAPLLHKFYTEKLYEYSAEHVIKELYYEGQSLINNKDFFNTPIPEHKLFIPHIDVYKQLGYDKPSKATSLKWIEFSMGSSIIKEMPYSHTRELSKKELEETLEYCWVDVDKTMEFFEKVKFETELRLLLSKDYNINLVNAPEPKMVRDIFGKFICEEMGVTYKELRDKKTIRQEVRFKDIIFPYVKFETPFFKEILKVFENHYVVTSPSYKWYSRYGPKGRVLENNDIALEELKKKTGNNTLDRDMSKFSYSFNLQDMKVDLGLGGIHACATPGVYEPEEDEVLEDADGTSFYPFLAINNNLRPEHLGEAFSKVYPKMYEERQKYSKKDPRNYVFKIILNSK